MRSFAGAGAATSRIMIGIVFAGLLQCFFCHPCCCSAAAFGTSGTMGMLPRKAIASTAASSVPSFRSVIGMDLLQERTGLSSKSLSFFGQRRRHCATDRPRGVVRPLQNQQQREDSSSGTHSQRPPPPPPPPPPPLTQADIVWDLLPDAEAPPIVVLTATLKNDGNATTTTTTPIGRFGLVPFAAPSTPELCRTVLDLFHNHDTRTSNNNVASDDDDDDPTSAPKDLTTPTIGSRNQNGSVVPEDMSTVADESVDLFGDTSVQYVDDDDDDDKCATIDVRAAGIVYMFVEPDHRGRSVGALALETISYIHARNFCDYTVLVANDKSAEYRAIDDTNSGNNNNNNANGDVKLHHDQSQPRQRLVEWYTQQGYRRAPLLQTLTGSPNGVYGISMMAPTNATRPANCIFSNELSSVTDDAQRPLTQADIVWVRLGSRSFPGLVAYSANLRDSGKIIADFGVIPFDVPSTPELRRTLQDLYHTKPKNNTVAFDDASNIPDDPASPVNQNTNDNVPEDKSVLDDDEDVDRGDDGTTTRMKNNDPEEKALSIQAGYLVFLNVEPEFRGRSVGALALETISYAHAMSGCDYTYLLAKDKSPKHSIDNDNKNDGEQQQKSPPPQQRQRLVEWYTKHGYQRAPLLQHQSAFPDGNNGIAMIAPTNRTPPTNCIFLEEPPAFWGVGLQ